MTISEILPAVQTSSTTLTTNSCTRTDLQIGDVLIVHCAGPSGTTYAVSDDKSGGSHSWTKLGGDSDIIPPDDTRLSTYGTIVTGFDGISGKLIVTAVGASGVWFRVVRGASALPTSGACAVGTQTAAGTGTNAITTANATPDAGASAWLVLGIALNASGTGGVGTLSIGTATPVWVDGGTGWDFTSGGAGFGRGESRRVTSGAATAATFTASHADDWCSNCLIFPEVATAQPARQRKLLDEQTHEAPIRRPWRPVSGIAPSAPPRARRRQIVDEQAPPDLALRLGTVPAPPILDTPPLVAYDTSDLDQTPIEDASSRRRALPASGPIAATVPIRGPRLVTSESIADERIAFRASPLASFAPQAGPPTEREPRLVDDLIADDPIRLRPSPLVDFAPQAPPPVVRARRMIDEAAGDEAARLRQSPPTAPAAIVAPLFAPRRSVVDEAIFVDTPQTREGVAPLRATDAPPVTRARPPAEDAPQDERQRRVGIPTSGTVPSNPPPTRARPVSDEQSPEVLLRRPWQPVSAPLPSAPPVLRARPVTDEQSPETLQRKPWAPDFARVDPPPITRARSQFEDGPAQEQPQRKLWVATAAPITPGAPPLTRARVLPDEQSLEVLARRPWLPVSAPPPSPPPITRARTISDERFPETLQRKPWTPFFGRVDPAPSARARPLAEDPFPPDQSFLDSIWRRIRSIAAFFGIAPTPSLTRAAPDCCAPMVDLTDQPFTAVTVDLTDRPFTAAMVDLTASQFTAPLVDCRTEGP